MRYDGVSSRTKDSMVRASGGRDPGKSQTILPLPVRNTNGSLWSKVARSTETPCRQISGRGSPRRQGSPTCLGKGVEREGVAVDSCSAPAPTQVVETASNNDGWQVEATAGSKLAKRDRLQRGGGSKRPPRDRGHEVADARISMPQSGIWGCEE